MLFDSFKYFKVGKPKIKVRFEAIYKILAMAVILVLYIILIQNFSTLYRHLLTLISKLGLKDIKPVCMIKLKGQG